MSENENNQLEELEEVVQNSIKRSLAYGRQFVSYQYEYKAKKKCADMEKLLDLNEKLPRFVSGFEISNIGVNDNVIVTKINRKAVELRDKYYSLNYNEKAIVLLGLNTVVDVSFNFPDGQSTLFTNKEWSKLRELYKPAKYNTSEYDDIKLTLQPITNAYRRNKSFDINWVAIYQEAKKLEKNFDPLFEEKHSEVAFVIYFILQIMKIIRYSPQLFDSEIDNSEWNYIVKFWGPITERLFRDTNLRLKW